MKESKAMMRKEVAFMKKKGAPKSMIRHEEKEMGGGKGKVKKFAGKSGSLVLPPDRYSGYGSGSVNMNRAAVNRGMQGLGTAAALGAAMSKNPLVKAGKVASIVGPAVKGIYDQFTMPEDTSQRSPEPETAPIGNRKGGYIKSKSSGGSYRRQADGMAHKGKTKGHVVKMREGGAVGSFRRDADGIASKGKTRGKIVKMRYGGEC